MGLDMYLSKKIYIGANYSHNSVKGEIDLENRSGPIKINLQKVTSITEEVGYWRKANHVHQWFVHNVQRGKDDCKEYGVEVSDLKKLKDICIKALETKDSTDLPRAQGFFFGSIEIDEAYFEDLKHTVEMLSNLDPDCEYYYQSSW